MKGERPESGLRRDQQSLSRWGSLLLEHFSLSSRLLYWHAVFSLICNLQNVPMKSPKAEHVREQQETLLKQLTCTSGFSPQGGRVGPKSRARMASWHHSSLCGIKTHFLQGKRWLLLLFHCWGFKGFRIFRCVTQHIPAVAEGYSGIPRFHTQVFSKIVTYKG